MNIIAKKELESRLFLRYGMNIKVVDEKEEYDINEIYTFEERNNTLNKTLRVFKSPLNALLYTNIYWKESDVKRKELYESQDDIEDFEINESIIFNVQLNNKETLKFKPDYVSKKGLKVLHYFDRSYYKNDETVPRDILDNIIDYFENIEKKYTLELI